MTKNYFSDGVLVYDRYYCTKPHTPLLVIKRILLAVVYCVSSLMFILTEFAFPVSLPAMAAVCGVSCAVFSTILVFIRKRWLILASVSVSGFLVWLNFGILMDRLSYFADACMLLVEGRFLYPRRFLFHREALLDVYNNDYVKGVVLGTVLMCLIYSLIVSLCFSGRIRPALPALLFIVLCVPVLISERIEFSFWLIPALASLAGAFAIRKNYSGGLAVKHSSFDDYRKRMRTEERSFLKHISSAPMKKRTEMRCNYYSKYFGTGMYCAALTAVCIMIGATIIPSGGSIDYSGIYELFSGIGSGETAQSPFESGSASEYFTHSGNEQEGLLNIVSPGRGEREMIRVSYNENRPFYLRGDIGIDFTGRAWTTAVTSEPEEWRTSGLKDSYRPCENRVIYSLLLSSYNGGLDSQIDGESIILGNYINIEYLCNTDVVFLPPYTADFSFYSNDSFEVYADYAVRVSESAGSHINSVECVAMIPSYTSNELYSGDAEGLAQVERTFERAFCEPNDIYSSVIPEMQQPDILSRYEEYVGHTYLGIPENYVQEIESYIRRCLYDQVQQLELERENGSLSEVQYRYRLASVVADYLRSNYTYSLDGSNNSSEPVLQFLNDTKQGHCSLYASAMTLILRQLGVPARYCTGFYVESADGSGSVLLREKNLHAWVEVYVGQLGWVTFDPTSSAAYPGRGYTTTESDEQSGEVSGEQDKTAESPTQSAAAQTEQAATADTQTENSSPLSTAEPSSESSESQPEVATSGNPAPVIIIVIAAVAAIGAAEFIVLRLKALKNAAKSELDRLHRCGTSRDILLLILSLLELFNVRPSRGELAESFWKRVDEKYGTALADNTALLEAVEFGSHEGSEEERSMLYSQLERIVDVIDPFRFPCKRGVLRFIISRGNREKSK